MNARFAGSAALVAMLLTAAPARAAYHALEEIPVESPVYHMVEDLSASYGSGTAFLNTRPWDRADVGRFLDQLVTDAPQAARDPLVVRLRRELEPARGAGAWEPLWGVEDEQSSLEVSPYVRANFAQDQARSRIVRDFRGGLQGSLAFGDELQVWTDVYAGTQSPGGHGNPSNSTRFGLIEGVRLNSYFDRGTVTWRGRYGRLEVGHTWLRWGPGAWGSMALSDGAPAFDVAEARVPLFHRAQLEWFVALLDPAVQNYLAGHRLELRPTPRLDLSFAELTRFDGTGSVPLFLLPVTPYSLTEKRVIKSSDLPSDSLNQLGKNNVMWAFDAAWRWKPGVRVYGELAIDDVSFSSVKRPRALAWQLGLDARHAVGAGAVVLRGEYSRVYNYTYSSYDHLDFEFAGLPTGFALGPDVDRLNGRLEWQRDPAWTFGLDGAYTRKGEGWLGEYWQAGVSSTNNLYLTGVLDADLRADATADWSPGPGLTLGLTGGFAHVTGLAHVSGATAHGAFGQTRCTVRW